MSALNSVKEILKDDQGKSADPVVLTHAESDAIISACEKGLNSDTAKMFVDRKLCGFCGGKDFQRRFSPTFVGFN
jgi:deoxycytidylate deaminase